MSIDAHDTPRTGDRLEDWIRPLLPLDRDLDQNELAALATRVGGEPRFWRDRVRHDPGQRYYSQLYRDSHLHT